MPCVSEAGCEEVMFDQNNNENVFVFSEYQSISGQPVSSPLSPEIFQSDSAETDDSLTIVSNDLSPKVHVMMTGTNGEPSILSTLEIGISVNGQQPQDDVSARILEASIEPIEVRKKLTVRLTIITRTCHFMAFKNKTNLLIFSSPKPNAHNVSL